MVRVVSSGFSTPRSRHSSGSGFSTPRSRHSSGEDMIDRFAALKALSALSADEKLYMLHSDRFGCGNLVIDSNTDTNDSFSGADSDADVHMRSKEDCTNDKDSNQDPVIVKKERRKERNKLSAQNYRKRRRQQASTAQKTLDSLESHHKVLLEKVRQLEAEKHIVEEYLKNCVKIPWCPHHQVTTPTIPPPLPPAIPEHAIPENVPCTSAYSNDNSPMAATQPVPQNLNSGACADVRVQFQVNTDVVNKQFTNGEINNNNAANRNMLMEPCPTQMEENNNNNDMSLRMSGTSSPMSSGSSVS